MKKILAGFLLALPMLAVTPSQAQPFPNKAIRWLVPYPAGGGSDFLARNVSQVMSARIGQPIVVENKPGGNTAIAASEIERSPADGYTVLSADNGTLVFNAALYKKLTYDPKDLVPVTLLGRFPMILVVGPSMNVKDAKDFIAQVKAKPEGINYASAGAGSPHHLAMEVLKQVAGLKMTHAAYKGAAPALADVAGGQVPAMMVDMAAGAGFIKGGKVRALAVANPTRLAQLPDVPTFAEIGLKDVQAAAMVVLTVRAGTPQSVIDTLNKDAVATIKDPALHKKLVDFGIEPVGNSPAQAAQLVQSEIARWHKLIREQNITLD